MNANPFSIVYYYHPDKVGGYSEAADTLPKPGRSSRLWKAVDWIAEVMILAGARLHRACRSHTRVNSMNRNMNDHMVPLR